MKRGASPVARADAPSALVPLTRRIIALFLAGGEGTEVRVAHMQQMFGLRTRRPLYVVLDVLHELGCTERAGRAVWRWRGSHQKAVDEALAKARASDVTQAPSRSDGPHSTAQGTHLLLRYLSTGGTRSSHRVLHVASDLGWDGRGKTRLLYDLVNVFHAIGLVECEAANNGHGKRGVFRWTPAHAFSNIPVESARMPSQARVALRLSAEDVQRVWETVVL